MRSAGRFRDYQRCSGLYVGYDYRDGAGRNPLFLGCSQLFDRIGRIMVEWQNKPFWHISPSGKEKVLVWIPWSGYAFSHVEKAMSTELVAKYQDRLDTVNFPYEISYERWSGHGDNAEPDGQICEFIKAWSQEYEWPKFRISSTSEAFSAFEKRHGKELPEFKGDLTPYWEDEPGRLPWKPA